jgi:cytochrome P450
VAFLPERTWFSTTMRSPGERERIMTVTRGSFRFSDAPMQRDRTAGWRFVREAGDVFQDVGGTWYLTSLDAVRFAHRNPDIFSSARAFDELGSPVPLITLAVDPSDHCR